MDRRTMSRSRATPALSAAYYSAHFYQPSFSPSAESPRTKSENWAAEIVVVRMKSNHVAEGHWRSLITFQSTDRCPCENVFPFTIQINFVTSILSRNYQEAWQVINDRVIDLLTLPSCPSPVLRRKLSYRVDRKATKTDLIDWINFKRFAQYFPRTHDTRYPARVVQQSESTAKWHQFHIISDKSTVQCRWKSYFKLERTPPSDWFRHAICILIKRKKITRNDWKSWDRC